MNKTSIKIEEMMPMIVESLDSNKKAMFTVVGTSMEPFLKHKETKVTIEKKQAYDKYDIVLFNYGKTVRLHRIIKMTKDEIIAQGDNLLSKERITKQDIIGYVSHFEHNGKITSCDSRRYKRKVFLWLIFKPIGIRVIRK
jgi:phage repressor protein C with HTH and peptisase S24 domain